MPNGLSGYPFEFALGVLSLRSTLAQQDAHLQQIRAQQRIQAELEAEKNRIAEQGNILQYQGHHEAVQAQIADRQAQISSNEKIAEMRLKEVQEDKQRDREARAANITSKIGKEPVFVPSWMKLPSEIPVPEITDPQSGEKKPAYTIGRFSDPNGQGEFIFPITNAEHQEKYDKLKADIQHLTEQNALMQLHGQLYQAQTDRIQAIKGLLGYLPATVIKGTQDAWQKFNDENTKAIAARRALNAQDPELSKMEADPFYRIRGNQQLTDQMRTAQGVVMAVQAREAEALGSPLGPTINSPAQIGAKKEILQSLPPTVTAPPAAFPKAVGKIEEHGVVSKEGAFLPEKQYQARKMMARLPLREGVGVGRRVTYYGETGQELGQEIYSEGGTLIRQTGAIPPGGTVRTLGGPQAQPGPGATAPAGPAGPAAGAIDLRRLKALNDKIKAGTAKKEELDEFNALLKAAGR